MHLSGMSHMKRLVLIISQHKVHCLSVLYTFTFPIKRLEQLKCVVIVPFEYYQKDVLGGIVLARIPG